MNYKEPAKKIVIGTTVLGVFALYSLGIRDKVPVLSKPSSIVSASSNSSGTVAGSTATTGQYKDGAYNGSVADAYYGNVQVSVTIKAGGIVDVQFLQYPNTHSTSVDINQQAMPYLKQEAIQAKSANVQIVSGATYTSQAFTESLSNALMQAKV